MERKEKGEERKRERERREKKGKWWEKEVKNWLKNYVCDTHLKFTKGKRIQLKKKFWGEKIKL